MNNNLFLLETINNLIELNKDINNYISYKNSISIKEVDTKRINNELILNNLNSDINNLIENIISADTIDGGKGSGFFGHKGRKGKVGGSSKSGISFENLSNEQIKEVLDSKELKEKWGGAGQRLKNLALTNQSVMKRIQSALSTGHAIFNSQEERNASDELLKTIPQDSEEYKKLDRKLKQDDFFADLIDIAESKFGNIENSNNLPKAENLNELESNNLESNNSNISQSNTYSDIKIKNSNNFSNLINAYYVLTSTDYTEAQGILKKLKEAGLENTSIYKDLSTIKKNNTSDRFNSNREIEIEYIRKPSLEQLNNSLQNLNSEQGNALKYLCKDLTKSDFSNYCEKNEDRLMELMEKDGGISQEQDIAEFGNVTIETIEYYKSLPSSVLKAMFGFSSIATKINITDKDTDDIIKLIDNSPFERRDVYRGDIFNKKQIDKIKAGMSFNEVLQLNTLKGKQSKGFSISNISYNPIEAQSFSSIESAEDYYDKNDKVNKKYLGACSVIHSIPNTKSIPNYTLSKFPSEYEGYIKTDDYIVDNIEYDKETKSYIINYKERGR